MANFKNLIPYFETSFCAGQKSYENHDDPKHLSSTTLSQYVRYFLKVFDMVVKMSYVVSMYRRGALNSKSMHLFAISKATGLDVDIPRKIPWIRISLNVDQDNK